MIVTISGFIGSGKDTASEYLQKKHGFQQVSFAGALKDAVSSVFGWDREMIEGKTAESRAWREQVDAWWANRLDMPQLTPRWILQYWGTEVCRQGFHDDIWIASLENRILRNSGHVVISDARFPNELQTVKNLGGISVHVVRGPKPDWYDLAIRANSGDRVAKENIVQRVHSSEWAWVGHPFDYEINNNQTLDSLYNQMDQIIKSRV